MNVLSPRFGALALVGALLAAPASAELGPCGEVDDETLFSAIIGEYESRDFAGFVTMEGGGTMPAGSSGVTEPVVFWIFEEELTASSEDGEVPYHIVFERAEGASDFLDPDFQDGASGPLSDEEVEILVECDLPDIPRIIGNAEVDTPGGPMHLTLDLLYLGEAGMHGLMTWDTVQQGQQVTIRKPVVMTPSG